MRFDPRVTMYPPDERVESAMNDTLDGPVTVQTVRADGTRRTYTFDKVVAACDFSRFKTPFSTICDLITSVAATVVKSAGIVPSVPWVQVTLFASFLFSTSAPLDVSSFAVSARDVCVSSARDVPIRIAQRMDGRCVRGRYWYWSVAYVTPSTDNDRVARMSPEELERSLTDHVLLHNTVGADRAAVDFRTEYLRTHIYNVRFSPLAESLGVPRRLRGAQGRGNVWYSGGLASHWDVDSIFEQIERDVLPSI